MMRNLYLSLACAAFAACAAPTETSAPPSVNVDNFTTAGKPTKTVETPWGDKQVYDPTQDPEVIAAFKRVKNNHLKKGYDPDSEISKSYATLFANIRKIQYHDMIRLGCKIPDADGCGGGINYTVNTIRKSCEVKAFGEAELNRCEQEHTRSDGWHEILAMGAPQCSPEFEMIGSKDWRHKAYGDKEINVFFKSECVVFTEETE